MSSWLYLLLNRSNFLGSSLSQIALKIMKFLSCIAMNLTSSIAWMKGRVLLLALRVLSCKCLFYFNLIGILLIQGVLVIEIVAAPELEAEAPSNEVLWETTIDVWSIIE